MKNLRVPRLRITYQHMANFLPQLDRPKMNTDISPFGLQPKTLTSVGLTITE